jgi:hypothetical protein
MDIGLKEQKITFIQIYAPMEDSYKYEKNLFYSALQIQQTEKEKKESTLLLGKNGTPAQEKTLEKDTGEWEGTGRRMEGGC